MGHARLFSKATWGSAFLTVSFGVTVGIVGDARSAEAQIPASNGVFYACVRLDRSQDEGRLARLVAADEACKPRETRVEWSVTGPQGPQGPTGPAGAPGIQGPQGAPGAPGPTGAVGATGPIGATGATGPTGATGDRGPQGVSVATETVAVNTADCSGAGGVKLTLVDEKGTVVSAQPQFVCNGAVGLQGPPGAVGATGPTGATGPAGSGFGFRQISIGPTAVPSGSTAFNSVGSITATVPSAGSVWGIWTGSCLGVLGTFRFELSSVPNVTVANTIAATTVSASVTTPLAMSVSRAFQVNAAGTITVYVNAERVSTTGLASNCLGPLTVFFTPGAQLPQ